VDLPDENSVLEHGFAFRPIWWTPRVPIGWGSYLEQLPALGRGYHQINRRDLLTVDGLPQALLACYVWGTGSAAFLVGRRARVFRDNETARIADCSRPSPNK
jgi:8-oxoguanine DNA glycosylase-like protein